MTLRLGNHVIDESCWWEEGCLRKATAFVDVGGLTPYCADHAAAWKKEIARQDEREKARAWGALDWYQRTARKAGIGR